jgi:hypothetical protein
LAASIIGLLAAIGLTGCGAAQQAEFAQRAASAHAQLTAEAARCPKQDQPLARARCINDAEDRTIRHSYPYADLFQLTQAYRVALASRVQAKQLSQEDAELQFASINSQITAEAARRDAERLRTGAQLAAAQAQHTAAMGNLWAGLAALQQSTQPRAAVHCVRAGNTVTCH